MAKKKNRKSQGYREFSDIYDTWLNFSQEISDRIQDIAKESAGEYNDLYRTWSEYAQKMTEHMAKFSTEDEDAFENIQRIWTHYSGEIGERFVDVLSKDNGPYRELYNIWTDYSGRMNQNLSELMSENFKNQRELYELWMDAFGIKDKRINQVVPGVFEDVSHFWMEMWDKSRDMLPPMADGSTDLNARYKELNEFWTKNYSKWVMNFMRSPTFAKMNGNVLDNNLETIRANQEFFNQYLSTIGLPTKKNIDELYEKLTDLDRKLSEISRNIKSKKSK